MGPGSVWNWARGLIFGLWIVLLTACSGGSSERSSAEPPEPTPTVSFNAAPSSIDAGQSATLSWDAQDASVCTASGGWSGDKGLSGSQQVSPATSTNYTLSCDGAGGSASAAVTVQVNGTPTPSPIVNFSAADLVVANGGVTSLTWSSQNADTCTASGGWSGVKNLADSEQVGPITAGTTYTLSCTGPGGTAIEMLTVAVTTTVSLDWVAPTENVDGTPLTDLTAYRIYYGSGSRSYDDFLNLPDPNATSYAVDLVSGTYYVAMTAIDGEGNESAYSNEVIKIAN